MSMRNLIRTALATGAVMAMAAVVGSALVPKAGAATTSGPVRTATLPQPDHVLIVIEENHAESQVIGKAPYITSLANNGANFTQSFAVTHPSQPNYVALFSGTTKGVHSDDCLPRNKKLTNTSLAGQLHAAADTFTGYSESMPSPGYTGCEAGAYARKHNPWVNFKDATAAENQPFTAFPKDYSKLHDGTVKQADTWLKNNLDGYVQWARTHNSLLIVTFDEDDDSGGNNRIPTLFAGPMVKPGTYTEHITHYSVLRTVETMYGLPCLVNSCSAAAITDVWR